MDYQIVTIEEKRVAGVSAVTNNASPDMGQIIGGLWDKFYKNVFSTLKGVKSEKSMGIYTDYKENGDYTTMVCAEVDSNEQSAEKMTIPAGKYAKFIVHGNVVTAVQQFWTELWNMELDRAFICDFEEYQAGEDMDNMEIHMYISIK